MTIRQQGGIFGRNPTFNDVDVEGTLTIGGAPVPAPANTLVSSDIGVTVQGYDAATAKTNVSQTFTALQDFNFAGGGNYVATFQTTTLATPYTVNVGEGSGAADGYPLFRVGQSYSPYTDYFRVDSGTTNITVGKSLAMANGKGIDFSATSGTGTSELFSDYEEGVWSPTYTTDGTDFGSITYDTQDGYYTKIGNTVVLRAYLRTDAITVGSASGNVVVGGLPFSASNSRNAGSVIPSAFIGDHPIMIQASGSTAYLYYQASASGTTSLLQVADLNTGANDNTIVFTVTYQAS